MRSKNSQALDIIFDIVSIVDFKITMHGGIGIPRTYASVRHEIWILNKAIAFSSDTIITREKMFLVGYTKTDRVATEIWNRELAETQSVVFDLVWKSTFKG